MMQCGEEGTEENRSLSLVHQVLSVQHSAKISVHSTSITQLPQLHTIPLSFLTTPNQSWLIHSIYNYTPHLPSFTSHLPSFASHLPSFASHHTSLTPHTQTHLFHPRIPPFPPRPTPYIPCHRPLLASLRQLI